MKFSNILMGYYLVIRFYENEGEFVDRFNTFQEAEKWALERIELKDFGKSICIAKIIRETVSL